MRLMVVVCLREYTSFGRSCRCSRMALYDHRSRIMVYECWDQSLVALASS
ncbi:hypothetical protein HanRHA438_Chr11g0504051 [Helianthus annuus]|nr:hypothetical protein HanIR_Chr11g0528971 [Helianthus annuus]KAJ0870763.1 hypothetical protein HanRHA438_Chr11g0504051 [Helianthus annuus]